MATGDLKIDEGSTTNLPTYTITEDAETKEIPRSALNNSSGTEIGTVANPVVMSGVVNGTVNAVLPSAQVPTNYAKETGGNLDTLVAKDFATQTTLAAIKAKTDNIDVALSTRTKPADVQTISGTIGGTVNAVVTNLPAITTSGVQHTVVDNFPSVQQVFAPNVAKEDGGKLESILSTEQSINNKIPAQGQANMAGSQPVVIASDQTGFPTFHTTTTYSGTTNLQHFRTFANVAASQTDSSLVAAISGKIIRVVALAAQAGGTATNLTFNTKPAGAGSAISMTFQNAANAGEVLPLNEKGWFQTNVGEGLTVTTGAGSTTGIQLTYLVL